MKNNFSKKGRCPEYAGLFLFWNLLLSTFLTGAASHPSFLKHPPRFQQPKSHNMQPTTFYYFSESPKEMMAHVAPLPTFLPHPSSSMQKSNRKKERNPHKLLSFKKKQECDGKANFIQDLGIIAIIAGSAGTLMGIFSAAYFSVVGNMVSVINAVLSFILGIPSAIITYLAASDRLSYAFANVLSILSFANTFYGMWSIDVGNKDIILSQIGNFVGILSLLISILTTFPDLLDEILRIIGYTFGMKRELNVFIRTYGCTGQPTMYQYFESFFKAIL